MAGTRRRARRWVTGLLLAALLWLGLSCLAAWQLTRRPLPPHPEVPAALVGEAFESVRLTTADGEELGAWFADGEPDAAGVVLLHGKDGTRSACLPAARALHGTGRAVLAVTLRGHGDSTGERLDFGPRARADVIAAVTWLERRRPGAPVVVRGSSLGGAAAVFAAAELGERVHGWVFESMYTDLPSAVRHRAARRLPDGLDRLAAVMLLSVAPLFLEAPVDAHDVRGALAAWRPAHPTVPVLMLAGGRDPLLPEVEARALAAAAGVEPVLVPGGGHEGLHLPDEDAYGARLVDLVTRAEAHAASREAESRTAGSQQGASPRIDEPGPR